MGQKKAREIWFLCRQYDAQQALEMGLVNTVVPLAELVKPLQVPQQQPIYHKNLERVVFVTADTAGRAPAEVVERERENERTIAVTLEKLEQQIDALEAKLDRRDLDRCQFVVRDDLVALDLIDHLGLNRRAFGTKDLTRSFQGALERFGRRGGRVAGGHGAGTFP